MSERGKIIFKGSLTTGQSLVLTGKEYKSLLLWKPRVAEAITVCSTGSEFEPQLKLFRARVTGMDGSGARLLVFEEFGVLKKVPAITLLQALPEKERMELIIEKTTELGVSTIVPFKSKKSISLPEREAKQKKAHKWVDVALKAAKQSRRPSIPEVLSYRGFDEALSEALGELKIILREGHCIKPLKEVLKDHGTSSGIKEVDLLVGPEGGFDEDEIEAAGRAGFIPAGLGPRVLRTETAAIIGVALVGYEFSGFSDFSD
jgi:16S rRNA (uracil1498-N3)-methyltransferase